MRKTYTIGLELKQGCKSSELMAALREAAEKHATKITLKPANSTVATTKPAVTKTAVTKAAKK